MPEPLDDRGAEAADTRSLAVSDELPPPQRVDLILSGAAAAFSENGFAATSMRQIAEQTDTSLGAIYYHFDSKESILRAILVTNLERVQDSLVAKLEGIDDPRAALEAFIGNHIDFFGRHLEEMRVMAHELDTLSGAAGAEVAILRRSYTRRAGGILAALRPDLPPEELRIATLCLFGMLNWTYRWFHTMGPAIGPARLAERMSSLFLGGFLNDPELHS